MWYLIDTGFNDPYFNMAYDESLMDCVSDENTVFLRFFNFSPISVSLGYHQKAGGWLRDLENKGIIAVEFTSNPLKNFSITSGKLLLIRATPFEKTAL